MNVFTEHETFPVVNQKKEVFKLCMVTYVMVSVLFLIHCIDIDGLLMTPNSYWFNVGFYFI